MEADLLIRNASELLTLSPSATDEEGLGIIRNGAVLVGDGRILWAGDSGKIPAGYRMDPKGTVIDASGKVVMPGLVDSHTHLVFGGSRENEFEMRIRGLTYLEIAERGGGIVSTVEATRRASFDELYNLGRKRLDRMLSMGTTTVEAKSGYGLSLKDEIKILRVLKALNESHPVEIIPTFLGAHTLPKEFRADRTRYVDLVAREMIPMVAGEGLAEFCDVFCEEKAFTLEESRRILEEGKRHGLKPKIHADQLSDGSGASLAAELRAFSADHLEFVNAEGIKGMAEKGVAAVLLPGASLFLSMKRFPPARELIEKGVPVALATDFNPGSSMTESLPLMMTLGCLLYRMLPHEVIAATTLHGAAAIDRADRMGSIDPGKQADLVVFDVPHYRCLPYHFGVNHTAWVVKKGKIVRGYHEDPGMCAEHQ